MVLMICGGIFALPAVMCSGMCSGIGSLAAESGAQGQGIWDVFLYLAIGSSLGSIIVGAMVKKLKKATSGIAAFIFAVCFTGLLLQGNMMGLVSAIMLVVAGIMIFVAPAEQFKNIQKVQVSE